MGNLDAKAENWITFRPAIGGIQIHLNETQHYGVGTLGFAAIDEYGNTGYVTAEHVVDDTQYQIWQPYDYGDDDYKLGKATRESDLDYSDSAWVPCDSTFAVLPKVYNPTIGSNDDFFVESFSDSEEGDYVYFAGIISNLQGGTVINDDEEVWNFHCGRLYHQCTMNASAINGDSGSPVFKMLDNNSIEIVGLLQGINNGNVVYSHISYVNDDLDVAPYTVYDMIIPGQTYPPNDLDGDGLYEDLTGDGTFGFDDVVCLFNMV
ncbi:hypothetical protein [uncultured Methanolobus sp.]|uniref:hypothetical protein n=1 Tax=uncultured Methanolobus sp. TaxID=218300 RepID=UPI002AAB5C90|nr:hypothetical protein [uncultured Methanolobus sp.]